MGGGGRWEGEEVGGGRGLGWEKDKRRKSLLSTEVRFRKKLKDRILFLTFSSP